MIHDIFSSEISVNCWFCNENSKIQKADKQSWTCFFCKQYNGFTEEGDYNKELSEQYNVKDYKTKTLCTSMDSGGVQSLLCEPCSKNQVMKVRQLATFTPFHEVDYDQEVDMYKNYLEHLYSLCATCEVKVRDYLHNQDSTLMNQLDETQHQRLANLSQRNITEDGPLQISRNKSYENFMSRIMLVHSSLCSLFIFIANLRLEAGSMVVSNGTMMSSYLTRLSGLLMEALPGQLTLDMRINIAVVGVLLCLCGLYIAGRYSFYPEDVIHLLLWLLTIVVLSVVDIPLLWNLCLNSCMLCISFLCCVRSRTPRNVTFPSIQRKELAKPFSPDTSCDSETAESVNMPNVSNSANTLLSDVTDEPQLQFETVRQNLESVSLGLGKMKGSNSSIWMMPPIVTSSSSPNISSSSDLLPDSSSDLTLQKRGVLMPSRLGFLSYDPHLQSKDYSSELSPSPSPFMPISTASSRDHSPTVLNPLPLPRSSLGQRSQPYASAYDSFPGPCDSRGDDLETLRITHPKKNTAADRPVLPEARTKQVQGSGVVVDPNSKGLRRSARLAMAGRPPKPWSLRKSLSCTSAHDPAYAETTSSHFISYIKNKLNSDSSHQPSCPTDRDIFDNKHSSLKTTLRNGGTKQHRLKPISKADLSEISDDENWSLNKINVLFSEPSDRSELQNDFSWKWIFLGLVIGVSLTTNVFLLYGRQTVL